jgi:HEAT repeat protein
MRTLFRISILLGLTAALAGVKPHLARAEAAPQQAKPKTKAKAKNELDTERLKKSLEGDEAQALAALDELSAVSPEQRPQAAELVNQVLARGGNVKILLRALEVAGGLAQPSSSRESAAYVNHRQAEVRRGAVRSLSQTGGPEAVAALRSALRGKDASLRGVAASGLATLKAKEAVPDLFAVLPHDVPEAAGAIGELCGQADCQRFVELLGKLPFDLMESGLSPVVLRTDPELGEDFKIDVVDRLRKLQTEDAATLIRTMLAQFPANGSVKVKVALIAASQGKPARKADQ